LTADALHVRGLRIVFGGLVAVDGVDLDVPVGRLTGLIGPNGAGKTTTFNACTGLVRPTEGIVTLFGRDITLTSPPARARLGLGRTFQRMELYDRLTVEENVALGREANFAGRRALGLLWGTRAERAEITQARDEAIELCGLGGLRGQRCGVLSTGQRRLVELARALAGDFRILLLDEPSSGLDVRETEAFGRILRAAVEDRGAGILLVEHDMALVTSVCEYVYVLDFGRLIAEGALADVTSSPAVRTAYLGTEVA